MDVDLILKVAGIVSLFTLAVFFIFLIFYIGSLNRFIKQTITEIFNLSKNIESLTRKLAQDIDDLKTRIQVTLDNLDDSMIQIKNSFHNIDEKVNTIEGIFKPFQDLSKYIYIRVAEPLQVTARTISGASKALKVFFDFFSQKKGQNGDK